MNFFRLLGDVSHLAAIIILLLKIWKTRSCAGISGKGSVINDVTQNMVHVGSELLAGSIVSQNLEIYRWFSIRYRVVVGLVFPSK